MKNGERVFPNDPTGQFFHHTSCGHAKNPETLSMRTSCVFALGDNSPFNTKATITILVLA